MATHAWLALQRHQKNWGCVCEQPDECSRLVFQYEQSGLCNYAMKL